MLPQFELQAKRRLHHVKRRRQEQRRRVAIMVFSVTFLLGLLIFFNVYYIYRNHPSTGGSILENTVSRVRRRGDAWVAKDAQPFVSCSE
jgi:multidrug resistance efflux pump